LSLNPEKLAALDAKVNAKVERQVAALIERIEAKIEECANERLDAKLKKIEQRIAGCSEQADNLNQRTIKEHDTMNRLGRRIRALHYRLSAMFDWYNSMQPEVPESARDVIGVDQQTEAQIEVRPAYSMTLAPPERDQQIWDRLAEEVEQEKKNLTLRTAGRGTRQ
jgi:uncharacterized coiled-coil protein SlyX